MDSSCCKMNGFGSICKAVLAIFLLTSLFPLNCQAQVPPSFVQEVYTASIDEDTPIGTQLTDLTIQATDPDVGDSLTYSIPPDEGITQFSIHPSSALITVEQALDYETRSLYSFTVAVMDSEANRDTAIVVIRIDDVNDNPPVFERSTYVATSEENVPVNTFVTDVSAVDIDSAANGEVTYDITRGNDNGAFDIETATGMIRVAGHLDRESTPNYTLTVQALDGGTPPMSATVIVTVTVLDQNDNVPVCAEPSFTATVPEDLPIGSPAVTVRATDEDSGTNGKIAYNIISGNENETFGINSTTGVVFVARRLDLYETTPYNTLLTVQAVDGGQNALTSTCTVVITVDNTTSATTEQQLPHFTTVTDSSPAHRQSSWCLLIMTSFVLLLFISSSTVW